jgi:hypothetical protein
MSPTPPEPVMLSAEQGDLLRLLVPSGFFVPSLQHLAARILARLLGAIVVVGAWVAAVVATVVAVDVATQRYGLGKRATIAQLIALGVLTSVCWVARRKLLARPIQGETVFGHTTATWWKTRLSRWWQNTRRWIVTGLALIYASGVLARDPEATAFNTNIASSAFVAGVASLAAGVFAARRVRRALALGPGIVLAQLARGLQIPAVDFCIAVDQIRLGSISHPDSPMQSRGFLNADASADLAKSIYTATLDPTIVRGFVDYELSLLGLLDYEPAQVIDVSRTELLKGSGPLTANDRLNIRGAAIAIARVGGGERPRGAALAAAADLGRLVPDQTTADGRGEALSILHDWFIRSDQIRDDAASKTAPPTWAVRWAGPQRHDRLSDTLYATYRFLRRFARRSRHRHR